MLASGATVVLYGDEILPELVTEPPRMSVCVWCHSLGAVEWAAGLQALGPTALGDLW